MASIFDPGIMLLTLEKEGSGAPGRPWRNTYEIYVAGAIGTYQAWQGLVAAIATAEAALHLEEVNYTQARVSTWQEDSTPYNPLTFITFGLDGISGGRAHATEGLARNVVLFANRQAETGRQGKVFYRGALAEGDLQGNNAFDLQLTPAAIATFTALLGAFYSTVGEELDDAGGAGSGMVMARSILGPLRYVQGLTVHGCITVKPNKRWYNRAG